MKYEDVAGIVNERFENLKKVFRRSHPAWDEKLVEENAARVAVMNRKERRKRMRERSPLDKPGRAAFSSRSRREAKQYGQAWRDE